MSDNQPGGSAQAEYDRRVARHAEDVRRRRLRILIFGLVVAVAGVIVLAEVRLVFGALILLIDLIFVTSALFATREGSSR